MVSYRGSPREYSVYRRPFWDWALSLLNDPDLIPHMEWSARRLYKWDGQKWVRFIDEPWTSDFWWETQVCMQDFESLNHD